MQLRSTSENHSRLLIWWVPAKATLLDVVDRFAQFSCKENFIDDDDLENQHFARYAVSYHPQLSATLLLKISDERARRLVITLSTLSWVLWKHQTRLRAKHAKSLTQ